MESSTAGLNAHQVQLVSQCAGRPARISFFTPGMAQLLARVFGGIEDVALHHAILVECNGEVGPLPAGCPAVVEVVNQGELTILHTTVVGTESAHELVLTWPTEVRTQSRRQHPRVDVEIPLHFIAEGVLTAQQGTIQNLSAGGLAFTTQEPVPVGSEVTIAFGLGSRCYFNSIQASVVRCTALTQGGYQIGARFVDLHPATLQNLTDWVQKRLATAEGGHRGR